MASQEETRLAKAFSQIADTGTTNAALMWRGRNRFLTEKIIPVLLKESDADNFQTEQDDCGNLIIAGDNLSVMASLLTDFKGGRDRGVDIVYLDPPYNTGSDTFAYNDDYRFTPAELRQLKRKQKQSEKTVGIDDVSRHTKWLNHIAPRLHQAKRLLKSTGVIIASIDEHELPRLWLLMEEMFHEKNRLATLIWERSRKNDAKYISEGHEYMLVWAKDKAALDVLTRKKSGWRKRKDGAEEVLLAYTEAKELYGDDIAKIQAVMDKFFAELPATHPAKRIRFKKVDKRGMYRNDGNLNKPEANGARYEVINPNTGLPCKLPSGGWRYPNPAVLQKLIDDGRIYFGDSPNRIPSLITYLHEQEVDVQTSIIQRTAQVSVQQLDDILGKSSSQAPKDFTMLAELFALVTWRNKNAIILDPYAGSGTTAHAVLALNAEDGGKRRFILIENGDPNAVKQGKISDRTRYATDITAERVRRVIHGDWADGKPHPSHAAGFQFFYATKEIDRDAIMTADREHLADIILQVVEEDSNRLDCRMDGDYKYLIGKTRTGYGIALIWESQTEKNIQPLTDEIVDIIIDEARTAKVTKPVFVYAVGNTATEDDTLYRFQHIPDSILARLNLLPGEEEDAE